MAYIDTYSPNIGVRLRSNENDWIFGPDGNLTLPDIANPSINYANGQPYGGGAVPVTPTANGTFTTLPDFLEFVGGTYLRTGQTSEGVFFDGDAGDPEISYPVRSNFSINGTTKVTVTVDMVVNDECSDFGLCIFEEDIQPEWAWDPNPTRIAASYNCTTPYIYTLNDEISATWDIPAPSTYRVRFTYDPSNTPNITLETLDTSNTVLNTISIDGTLNTSINYYIGFAADQDATNLRTYIQNLNIDIDGGDTYTDSLQLSGGGNANTGNVTFDNINVIGTGNLHLQPDPANSGSYLDIFLTSGPDLHLVASASANLILGKDLGANVMTSWDGNTYVQAWDGNNASIWTFGQDGGTIFPTLDVQRGDYPSGTITGQTLLFGDAAQEAIISTADGTVSNENSQRLVINPGQGYDYGEGGDIYLWAGRGGDGSGSGGDIKIRGGQGGANTTGGTGGDGGYIRIEAGDSATTGGAPGYIDINAGINYLGAGGYVDIQGGQGHTIGGDAKITGGYGYNVRGGNVNIWGGGSANGQINEGNVNIQTGGKTWTYDPSGNLTLPNDATISDFSDTASLNVDGNRFAQLYWNGNIGNGNPSTGSDYYTWAYVGNAGFAVQHKNASTSTDNEWKFGTDGNLTLPTGTPSINYANGSPYGGGGISGIAVQDEGTNVVASANTINFVGNGVTASNVGGVATVTISGNSSQITNGNSNVSIPTSNDNVYINTNNGTSKQWIFNADGTLRAPGNVDIYGAINFPQQVSTINWSTYNIELSQYGRINTNVDFFANANTIGAQYLKGDGSNISNINASNITNAYSDSNVISLLSDLGGNGISNVGNIDLSGNINFTNNSAVQQSSIVVNPFRTIETVTLSANSQNNATLLTLEDTGNANLRAWQDINLNTYTQTTNNNFNFGANGNLTIPGNISGSGANGLMISSNGNVTLNSKGAQFIFDAPAGNFYLPNPGGAIVFADSSVQTTAYTGVAEAPFSIQSSDFLANAGRRYGVDTSAGAVTSTLPASPATGVAIFFADAGGAFASNNLTINPNGQTIMGASGNMTVSTNNQSFGLFFNGATWRTYN
jgi:hypothetical protein